MGNLNAYIKDLNIEEGQRLRLDCPSCRGVNTLSISRIDGVILYQCYKLMCNETGGIHEGMTAEQIKKRIALLNDSSSTYDRSQENIPMIIPEYIISPTNQTNSKTNLFSFIKWWGLDGVELLYDVKDNRAVFPIRRQGITIDAVGRSLVGSTPKWLRYTGAADVYLACKGKSNGVAVIVEDVISANTICSVCQNVTGIAILGTSLSLKHMEYLQEYKKIIVALDPDASHKNLQYRREIASWTGIDTIAMRLNDDIKYRETEDLIKLKALCG